MKWLISCHHNFCRKIVPKDLSLFTSLWGVLLAIPFTSGFDRLLQMLGDLAKRVLCSIYIHEQLLCLLYNVHIGLSVGWYVHEMLTFETCSCSNTPCHVGL